MRHIYLKWVPEQINSDIHTYKQFITINGEHLITDIRYLKVLYAIAWDLFKDEIISEYKETEKITRKVVNVQSFTIERVGSCLSIFGLFILLFPFNASSVCLPFMLNFMVNLPMLFLFWVFICLWTPTIWLFDLEMLGRLANKKVEIKTEQGNVTINKHLKCYTFTTTGSQNNCELSSSRRHVGIKSE